MKKETIHAIVFAAVVLVVYNLVAFLIPFVKNETFWISYVFTLMAFGVVAVSIYIAFMRTPNAKSRFYGFPIARIGVIYGALQLVVSLLVMAISVLVVWWIAVLVYSVGFGAAVIGLLGDEVVVEEIQSQDTKLKNDVTLMRGLQTKVNRLMNQSNQREIHALAEEFRYSDPVSSEALVEIETELSAAVDALQATVAEADVETVKRLCQHVSALLAERNRLCKLNKAQ